MHWSQGNATALTTRWHKGGRARLLGRATGPNGQPLAGAHLDILAADGDRPQAAHRVIGTLRTGRDGALQAAVALDSGAPDKLITIRHADAPQVRARARLRVRGFIRLAERPTRARRGKTLELSGLSVPRGIVQIAVRGRGVWRADATTSAAANGRWRTGVFVPRYARPGRYRLEARVLDPGGLGFSTAKVWPHTIHLR